LRVWNWPHQSFQDRLDALLPEIAQLYFYCPDTRPPGSNCFLEREKYYVMLPKAHVYFIDECLAKVDRLQKDIDSGKNHVSDIYTFEKFLEQHGETVQPRKLIEVGRRKNPIILDVIAFAADPAHHFATCQKLLAEAKQAVLDHNMSVAEKCLLEIRHVQKLHERVREFTRTQKVLEQH
jgi:hypothetical protein